MATLEAIILGHECVRWLSNVRQNLRDNAKAYKQQADVVGADLARLAAIMTSDGSELLKTIKGVEDQTDAILAPAGRALVGDFLATYGESITTLDSAITELKQAARGLRDASKKTIPEIKSASNAVLAAVTDHKVPRR